MTGNLILRSKHYASRRIGYRSAGHLFRGQIGRYRYRVRGGLGVLALALIGVKPGNIPFDVISIIMAVIAAISAMQVAGGMDYLVQQTEKLLRKNPSTSPFSPLSSPTS